MEIMKNSKKIIVATFAAGQLCSLRAFADSYRRAFSCGGGAAIVDLNSTYKQDAQIVIKEPGVLRYFQESGLVRLGWGQQEIVIRGRSGYLDFSRNMPVLSYQEMNSAQDFVSMITFTQPTSEGDGYQGELFSISRNNSRITVQKFNLTNRLITPDPENGQTWYKDVRLDFLGEYVFSGCNPQ
jgi:hypothetical protein